MQRSTQPQRDRHRASAYPERFDALDVDRIESMVDEGGRAAAILEDVEPPRWLLDRPVLDPFPAAARPSSAERPACAVITCPVVQPRGLSWFFQIRGWSRRAQGQWRSRSCSVEEACRLATCTLHELRACFFELSARAEVLETRTVVIFR